MSFRGLSLILVVSALFPRAYADEVINRYEGDVHPLDPSTGWILNQPCEEPCTASVEDGHFVLHWAIPGSPAAYAYWVNILPDPGPPSLWVEWRYRSNHPWGGVFTGCDGLFVVDYDEMHDGIDMYGDTVISFEGGDVVTGLDIEEFHTYRFESADGINYRVSVDGLVFLMGTGSKQDLNSYLIFGGDGGCIGSPINIKNEWDYIRFGVLSVGEGIIASDPASGYLDPALYSNLDRFTITFDFANYVYLDDITVEVTGGIAPVVIQTLRRETDDVDTVEIVLDRPLSVGQRTRFIFDDGQTTNVLNYCLGMEVSCGDGCCDVQECATCTQDCQECGDGCCTHDETSNDCPADCPQVPAVSDWGLTILTLLTLTAGTLILLSRSRIHAHS